MDRIVLAHGGGGQLTDELVRASILPRLGGPVLSDLLDAGLLPSEPGRLALTVDSYVVQPLFFPGGDIGRLSVSGTVNDLSVCGARPVALALSLILEEGLERAVLERVLESVRAAASEAGVQVVTGDTKVVDRRRGDGMYVTTAGVGFIPEGRRLHPDRARPGDVLLINGPVAEHGLAVMLARQMPEVRSALVSDVAPLNGLCERLLEKVPGVKFMRDPTRGGLAGLAVDLAERSGYRVSLDEEAIEVSPRAAHAADMLGLDVLEVANEGKLVAVVAKGDAERALEAMRSHPLGSRASVIGSVQGPRDGLCVLRTAIGGERIVQKTYGEQLPRIC